MLPGIFYIIFTNDVIVNSGDEQPCKGVIRYHRVKPCDKKHQAINSPVRAK
ncbi:MAG: hypothetical protein ACM3VS_02965 [Candidatus Dadabacteria bacterium]